MSFFHPSSHPLNPYGTGPHLQQRVQPYFTAAIPGPPGLSTPQALAITRSSLNASPNLKSPDEPPASPGKASEGAKKKIYVRTAEEQFALPMSKVATNDGLVVLLTRLYSQAMLHRLQIRYDTTVLDSKGNPAGPISGGAVIYPEYWESLVEDGMRIVIKVMPEEGETSSVHDTSRATSESSLYSVPDALASPPARAESGHQFERAVANQQDFNAMGLTANKENDLTQYSRRASEDKPRTYSSAVKQSATAPPLGVSTNLANTVSQFHRPASDDRLQSDMPPELKEKLSRYSGRLSAMTACEASLKSITDPYGLTYQSCITLLEPLLPEIRRITHPRLSPNIVTIRPCHENTLWIFCVVQRILYPVTVRAFETIDIEELILRVLPDEISKEKVVVLWRNMKFGGEAIGPKYNAKKETRGTGGRNMWKRNLAVLAVKNAEVFVLVFENPAGFDRQTMLVNPSVIDLTATDSGSVDEEDTSASTSSYPRQSSRFGESSNLPIEVQDFLDRNSDRHQKSHGLREQGNIQKYTNAINEITKSAGSNNESHGLTAGKTFSSVVAAENLRLKTDNKEHGRRG
ncbi:hypothetical protein V1512DRAFT_257558 [Lipomyces arxii]|uniref:uncharacterized protein n=1 Tax=Lipomyces arxii TaxID=56418 RepID=UPI0034CE0FA5